MIKQVENLFIKFFFYLIFQQHPLFLEIKKNNFLLAMKSIDLNMNPLIMIYYNINQWIWNSIFLYNLFLLLML